MSYSAHKGINAGAYDRPFSGVGIEFYPLNIAPDRTGVTLHECGYLPDNSNWNFPGVFSPFWRLYYNRKRGHCVVFGEDAIELTSRHLMLIPDHCLFHCLGKQPVPAFWLAFSVERKLKTDQKIPILLEPTDSELCLVKDLCRMVEESGECEPAKEIYHFSIALLNIVLCRKDLKWQDPIPDSLSRAKKFIRNHLSEKITIPDIARTAGLSAEGLYRSFRRHFNTTPSQYISELRISDACHLLLHTDQSIDHIALNTGFPNRAYFSRVFHKITNEWPAAFRKKHVQTNLAHSNTKRTCQ